MKRITLILFCLVSIVLHSQQKAITETGDEVTLYEDGTWKYQNESDSIKTEIPINSKAFEKDNNSSFLLKSKKFNVGVWLNPKKWSFTKANNNDEAEYEFQLKGEDLYGMILTEKVEIPLETLKSIALDNGRDASPDLQVVKEEYRTINGLKVLLLQMNGTMKGIKFSYYGYYFSSTKGTAQFITYTSQNLLDSYKNECEILLNGLVEIN